MDPLQQQQQPLPLPPPPPPPVPTNVQQAQPPQPTSMLERLREQVSRELMPDPVEEMQRNARVFGAALLRGRGNFFEGLGAAQEAVEQQRARDQQARGARVQQLEQQAQREAELGLRRAEHELRVSEAEYNRSPTPENQLRVARAQQIYAEIAQGRRPTTQAFADDQGRVVLVNTETGQEIRRTDLRPIQTSRLNSNAENALRQNAANRAQAAVDAEARRRTLLGQTMSQDERTQMRDVEERRNLESVGLPPLPASGTAAPQQPAPAAPARELRYSGPQPPPRQQ